MSRRKRTPEENERREKIRELLKISNVGSMEDIQKLFKETIAEFMENGLEAELDEELGYSKYDYRNKETDNSRNGHSSLKRNSRSCTGFIPCSDKKEPIIIIDSFDKVLFFPDIEKDFNTVNLANAS